MRVNFRMTLGDVMRMTFYQAPRMLALQVPVAILIIWQTWTFISAVAKLDRSLLVKVLTFSIMEISMLIVITLAGAFALMLLTVLMYLPGRNRNIYTDQHITLSDDGILLETLHNKFDSKWAGVQRVGQTRRDIYVFLSQHGGHAIPKRAFSSQDEANAFFEYILRHWKFARGHTPA